MRPLPGYYIGFPFAKLIRRKWLHPHFETKYNALQRAAYFSVPVASCLSVATGWAIHKPMQLHWLAAIFGGYNSARVWHFWLLWIATDAGCNTYSKIDRSCKESVRNLDKHSRGFLQVNLSDLEPVTRISTSLLALCCQSGLVVTLATPTRARMRSIGSRSFRMSPLLIARFTSARIASCI